MALSLDYSSYLYLNIRVNDPKEFFNNEVRSLQEKYVDALVFPGSVGPGLMENEIIIGIDKDKNNNNSQESILETLKRELNKSENISDVKELQPIQRSKRGGGEFGTHTTT